MTPALWFPDCLLCFIFGPVEFCLLDFECSLSLSVSTAYQRATTLGLELRARTSYSMPTRYRLTPLWRLKKPFTQLFPCDSEPLNWARGAACRSGDSSAR